MERMFNCSGSPLLIEQCPIIPSGKDSKLGTAVHFLGEQALRYKMGEAPFKVYRHVEVEGENISVTDTMIDCADFYSDYVMSLILKYNITENFIESEVNVMDDIFGSLDYGGYVPYHGIVVVDYKNGYHKVPVLGNKQLLAYALGVYNSLSPMAQDELQWVKLVIVQQKSIDVWDTDVEMLLRFRDLLRNALEATKLENKPELKAGDWCKWCPAQIRCPAWDKRELELLRLDFKDFPVATELPKQLPKPQDLNPANLIAIIRSEQALDSWFKQARQYVTWILESGTDEEKSEYAAAGFSLKPSLGDREWIEVPVQAEQCQGTYMERHLWGDEEPDYATHFYTPPKLLSPAQMEKLKGADGKKLFTKEELEEYTTRETKGNTLKY